jgi:hypothetical protein
VLRTRTLHDSRVQRISPSDEVRPQARRKHRTAGRRACPKASRGGCWCLGSFSAAQGRFGLNSAIYAHNPEVAGSNPAPATSKSRSEA